MAINTNLYCLVEYDGLRTPARELPVRFCGVLNFNELTTEEVAVYHWYLVIRDENIDTTTEYYSEPVIDDIVKTVTYTTLTKTQEQIDADEAEAASNALQEELTLLENRDKALFRLFMSLADTLIANGTISATDFTVEERQLYQQAKILKPKIW